MNFIIINLIPINNFTHQKGIQITIKAKNIMFTKYQLCPSLTIQLIPFA